VFQLVHGVPDMVSRHLIGSPVIRKVSFTGSIPVGKHLMKLAADNVTRVTIELGGHAPVLIFDDCDLEKTLDMVVPQKFRNAGQVCVSPTRFYVQEGIYDAFIKGFAERTEKVKVGDGLSPTRAWARSPTSAAPKRSGRWSRMPKPKARGRRRRRAGGQRLLLQPTLLADVPLEADIMNDEPFGPVAVSRPFKDFDEAIEQANRLPYGLAAFAFTENGRRANILGDLDRGRHGRHQHLRNLRRRRSVRRGQGKRLRLGRRQGRAGELPGGEGDSPGLSFPTPSVGSFQA
jgi:succinate-semialdehyde dehydrogenase / glutarate-semialdehyde dehydrogenase